MTKVVPTMAIGLLEEMTNQHFEREQKAKEEAEALAKKEAKAEEIIEQNKKRLLRIRTNSMEPRDRKQSYS